MKPRKGRRKHLSTYYNSAKLYACYFTSGILNPHNTARLISIFHLEKQAQIKSNMTPVVQLLSCRTKI